MGSLPMSAVFRTDLQMPDFCLLRTASHGRAARSTNIGHTLRVCSRLIQTVFGTSHRSFLWISVSRLLCADLLGL